MTSVHSASLSTKPLPVEMDYLARVGINPKLENAPGEAPSCFGKDDDLPGLPVPDLDESLALFLESAEIHLTPAENTVTRRAVQDFKMVDGPRLQQALVAKAKTTRNWMEEWWLEHAYLRNRLSSIPFCNMAGQASAHHHVLPVSSGRAEQARRAGLFVFLLLRFWRIVRQERLVDEKRRDARPLSMDQFKKLFNTCRIPGISMDSLEYHFRTAAEGACPRHIMVAHKGRHFVVHPVDSQDRVLNPDQLTTIFTTIMDHCDTHKPSQEVCDGFGQCVGALTSLPRDDWAKDRVALAMRSDNEARLRTIQEAILWVSLDDTSPIPEDDLLWTAMCADSRNLWADKSYSIVVYANGTVVNNTDHAPFDGICLGSSSTYCDFSLYRMKGVWSPEKEWEPEAVIDLMTEKCCPWEELIWNVPEETAKEIRWAVEEHRRNCQKIEAKDLMFPVYGRELLRQYGTHPDTVVQLAIQEAYMSLHKVPAPVYETASTRHWWHGRTETIRSCTPEAVHFAKTILEEGPTGVNTLNAFKAAHKRHNEMRSRCESGMGIDRHLMGLQILSAELRMPTPEIFTCPGWTKSGGGGNFRLSTSFAGFGTILGAVPPMCLDGYGAFYRIGIDRIHFRLTSYRDHPETGVSKLAGAITRSLLDIAKMFHTSNATKSKI